MNFKSSPTEILLIESNKLDADQVVVRPSEDTRSMAMFGSENALRASCFKRLILKVS